MVKLSSALALIAMIPCIGGAQRPAAPAAREMVVRTMVGPRMMPAAMMMDAASMFLGCTGELQLTDAQVTKLAAIARRAEARQTAIRSRMDSAMTVVRSSGDGAGMPRDGAAGGMMMTMMRMPMPTDAERKAQHEDDRDAFSVLTPDQLATAWEMMAKHHGMAPGKI
jgi:hypothetical protein